MKTLQIVRWLCSGWSTRWSYSWLTRAVGPRGEWASRCPSTDIKVLITGNIKSILGARRRLRSATGAS